MVPCCERAERQYLNEDDTVKDEFLKTFSDVAYAEERDDKDSVWGKQVFAKRGFYPRLLFIVDGENEHNICNCACHTHGSMVMH